MPSKLNNLGFVRKLGLTSFAYVMMKTLVQKMLRCVGRWTNPRCLFILNCVVLALNVLLYVLNTYWVGSFSPFQLPLDSYFVSPLDDGDKALTDRTFRVFVDAVESANLTFFVYGGTLLGSLRHHDRIPWDDDTDVIMDVGDMAKITRVLSRLEPEFGLYRSGSATYASQWKFYPTDGRFVFHRQYRTPYIDIFFYASNETHVWNASPQYSDYELWLKRHVFPLVRRPYGDLTVPAPCNGLAVMGTDFDMSMCRSRDFNHLIEFPFLRKPVIVPCERLAHLHPFVHITSHESHPRSNKSTSLRLVRETLMLGNWTLRQVKTHSPCL